MHSDHQLQSTITRLKRHVQLLQVILLCVVLLVLVMGFTDKSSTKTFKQIIVEEIIVIDKQKRQRIVIAAEIGTHDTRVRSDTLEGILIMDERGVDRIVLGSTPTIQSGGRIVSRINNARPYGYAFNDARGDERGGMGFYDDRNLVSFGMDNKSGEGLTMFVADNEFYGQKVGLIMQTEASGQVVYIGSSQAGESMVNLDANQKGRLSLMIDSTARATIRHSDYGSDETRVLVDSEQE